MNRQLQALARTAERIRASADLLNQLDAVAGDGDMGVTMSLAADAVAELLPGLDGQTPAQVLRACGSAIARKAPSTSGTLIASGLLRAAKAADTGTVAGAMDVAALLDAARGGVADRGGAEPGSKTMLDALGPAAAAASSAAASGATFAATLRAAARAADEGAISTKDMRAQHGRAGWLADRSAGHEDAGARLIAMILAAYADAVDDITPNAG